MGLSKSNSPQSSQFSSLMAGTWSVAASGSESAALLAWLDRQTNRQLKTVRKQRLCDEKSGH
jgi:hypothetical protein